MKFKSLPDVIRTNAEKLGDKVMMRYKKDDAWHDITYREIGERVRRIAHGLISLGIEGGDRIALLSENRPEWGACDFGVLSTGAVTVPIYPTLSASQIEYILRDSGSRILFASDVDHANKVVPLLDNLPELFKVIVFDGAEQFEQSEVISLNSFYEIGETHIKENEYWYQKNVEDIETSAVATIIYTSGTTGDPKGVMLSHKNILANIEGSLNVISVNENDSFLSFLPLSHVFERMAGHFLAYSVGATVSFAESIDTVAANMGEVHPTVMTSVPRLYEKMYTRVNEAVEAGSPVKKKLFRWAFRVGADFQRARKTDSVGAGLKFKHGLAEKLVFSKLKTRVGGRLRFFVSGGAPLAAEIGEFFGRAGIIILEGYGLTETSPVICVSLLEDPVFGTVGPPLKNVELRIADDGEILTRGPHVMVGYFNNESATRETIDDEGWLHTGDIGELDSGGRLRITDRKKNILVTAGGKNVAPQPIENLLVTSPLIEQVMLIGDRRKFVSALIAPSLESLGAAAEKNDIKFTSNEELASNADVYKLMQGEVDRLQADVSHFEQVKKFVIIPRELSIEEGELTPTLKVKRKVVMEKFAAEIESIYSE